MLGDSFTWRKPLRRHLAKELEGFLNESKRLSVLLNM